MKKPSQLLGEGVKKWVKWSGWGAKELMDPNQKFLVEVSCMVKDWFRSTSVAMEE